jgi:hypothetical protein
VISDKVYNDFMMYECIALNDRLDYKNIETKFDINII